ncbi:proliferation marker protein Ki-67 isoform X1 [Phocoena sinus]|uniref:proliferation marker protein Ki-67 isoform X1 n=1 Tax=Phocoena sinus TaxID=42100 RepID=UPI0013C4CD72|nr:proliferation marker protein Ki-67 isoform X1 [Phocoena sinus]XP_032464563.1 proliferation marker protein Ki-67 isoform X1 [Phocoena sinus]
MGPTRRLVTIKRSGVDGPHFPLSLHTCLFGRGIECDIRIQLPVVSKQHCKIEINGQEAILFNFSSTNPTQVNGSTFDKPVQLKHGDVITVVDRSFRYENESHQNGSKSPEFPGQRWAQEPSRRVSRSSFPSNLDGKVQDSSARSKFTEDAASGRPVVHGKNVTGAGIVSGDSEDPVAGKTPNSVHSSECPGDNGRNATAPTAGDSQEASSVTFGIGNGELKAFSSRKCLKESDQNESPFRKLYESMKVELDVKSGKVNVLQNRRKSGSQSHCTPEKESTGGLQSETLVSLKSRPKSGQSPQIKADPASGEQGSSQTEGKRSDEPFQTPKETRSPSSLCTEIETLQTTTPERYSQQSPSRSGRSEDPSVVSGGASLNLDQSEDSRADIKTFPPRKFLPSIQTPVKVESFGNTPEKLCPRKRKRNPTNVDDLTTETEILHQTISAPLVPQVERKIQSDFLNKPEKLGMAADPVCPGLPGLRSADGSSFGDSTNKMDEVSLKRRRVSFGGRLRPELFDENLPPNTPLKRGETPKQRRSLVTHTPTVLKKIIKFQGLPVDDCSAVSCDSGARARGIEHMSYSVILNLQRSYVCDAPDRCRSLSKASSISSDSKSPHQTDIPKRGRRKSSHQPSKRASVDRSQHGILQMIYSKRRSGASEANLVVAKSWADVVKLGTKQTQTKAVKRGPPRPLSKRQRRTNNTPKKLTGIVHNQFSTGHANSPCTIIIGKAHIEKVSGPARPHRMLNNFVVNKPMDFSEDLSGLPEMFKTPVKEKPQRMSLCPSIFSNSEDLLGEELPVPHSGGKPLLCASENSGQNVSAGTQDAPKELSDQSSASPALRRQSMKIKINESITKTPRNVYKTAGAEMETPVSEAMTPKTTSSAKKLRRSMELRSSQAPGVECKNEGPKPDALENVLGRCLRKAPQPEHKLEGDAKESEARTEHMGSKGNSKHTIAVRGPRRASELRCELAADLTALESLQETQPEEDQLDIPSPLQTPAHAKEAVDAENKATKMLCKSPRSGTVGTPTRTNTQLKTPSWKTDVEDASALGKLTQTPGKTMPMHRESGGDKSIKLFKETPKQTLDPAENVAGSKRRPRTPKGKAPPLEDLAGFKELFQTPHHAKEPMIDDKTPKMLCQSPQLEPVNTPSRKGRLKTPSQKVDVQGDVSALRKPQQKPGETTHSHREPEGAARGIAVSREAPEEKLDPAENVAGSKRQPRTPKEKAPPLEDLAGLKELFQTPHHAKEPMTEDRTPKMLCRSPPPEPVVTSTSMTRRLKTPSQKVAVQEDLSALRKSTHSHREPDGGDRGIAVSQEAPGEKLDPAENVTGSKGRPRTPKEKAPPLEDLAGFQELFQTPDHAEEQMTNEKTTTIPCKSPAVEPVTRRTGRKRRFESPPGKVDAEEPSAPRKPTQTPGGARHSDRERADRDKSIKLSKETPKQKLDSAENINGSKRPPRTPKEKVQRLEDLAGFKELFQTPDRAKELRAVVKTPKTLHMSSQPQLIVTPTNRKRWLKTPLGKADVETELSACRMTQTPGETRHSVGEPVGDDKSIKLFQETPHQKLDSSENVAGSKRRPRTPKKKAPPLEDLAGLKELFQTPDRAKEPTTDDRPTNIPRQSPQPEPANTPSRKGRLKTPSQKVAVQEDVSALRKPQQKPGETTHSHREPEGAARGIAVSREAPEEKLDPAENVAGSKRQPRTPKEKAPPLEDLAGLKELFQTPHHAKEPMTEDRTPKMLCRSPPPEPVVTSTSMTRRLKTPSQKVAVQEDLSALRKSTHSHREPDGGDRGIAVSQEAPGEKLDPAENVTGSKGRPRTPKEKAPPLEDLAGFQELFQTPDHAEEQMTNEKTTTIPCKSPAVEPVTRRTGRKRRFESPPGKVDAEEPSAPRKPTQTPGDRQREPVCDGKDSKAIKENSRQKLVLAENVIGIKTRLRTLKEKAQPVEASCSFNEPFQKAGQAKEPVSDGKIAPAPCRSPPAGPVTRPASRKRRVKSPPEKVGVEEPSAPKKPTQITGDTQREPVCDEKDSKVIKETSRLRLNPAENVIGIKSRLRTFKEKTQPVEDSCSFKELFQKPGQAKEPVSDVKITAVPCQSPPAGPVTRPASRRRRLKSPLGKVDLEELSVLREPIQTAGETMHREPVGDENNIKVFKETSRQNLDSAEDVICVKSRRRTFKEKSQPLEDPAGFKELFQKPGQASELGNDASGVKRAPKQTADRRRPVEISRRVLRAPKVRFMGDLVGSRDPVKSPGESCISPSPKRKLGEDARVVGRKRLCPTLAAQDPEEEKPLQKKQRTAPRERREPPKPSGVKKRSLRILAQRTKPVGNLPNNDMKTKPTDPQGEDAHAPNKGMSLRTRRPTKTNIEEQRPGSLISAGKIKIKRSEKKSTETSQEMKLQSPEEAAENPTAGGKVQDRRRPLRSGKQNQKPLPDATEETARRERVEIPLKKQEEKEATEYSDFKGLRSRKISLHPRGNPSESESEQRVTRGARRCANSLQKENDNVGVKKIRTRSHRDSEDK